MTTRIAIGLALLILLALWADRHYIDSAGLIWVGRKLIEFLDWITFWNRL